MYADAIIAAEIVIDMTDDLPGERPPATHVALHGEHILAVGTSDAMLAVTGPDTVHHEFPGATVLPGLSDGHLHPVLGLEMTRGVSLYGARSLDEVLARLRAEASARPDADWILAWGLDAAALGETVSGTLFDDVADGRAVFARIRDGHSAVVNTAALAAAGIDRAIAFDSGASVVADADGRPTGHLLELEAIALFDGVLPEMSEDDRADTLLTLLESMAASGLTSGQVMDMLHDSEALLVRAEERGDLAIRLRLSPLLAPDVSEEEIEQWAAAQGRGGRRWVIEGVKIMLDGTVEGGTAWLEHADAIGENHEPLWDPERYAQTVRFYAERGIPTATHAIGDRAVRFVLDTFAELPPSVRSRAPHRVEHIETVPAETIARFAELGIIASMQPLHFTRHADPDGNDGWTRRVGAERRANGNRVRDFVEHGVTLVLGSDWPVADYAPLGAMADAILRRPHTANDARQILPAQALTPAMTIAGYTSWSAAGRGAERTEGSIAPGFRADLTILAGNPLTMPPAELADTPVLATVLGGQVRRSDG